MLVLLALALVAGCTSKPRFRAEPEARGKQATPAEPRESRRPRSQAPLEAKGLLGAAAAYLGTPYRYGGEDRAGMDCSGLVWRAALDAWSMKLPRVSRDQAALGFTVMPVEIRRDDLVFFSVGGRRIDHVGIADGRGRFLHASRSSGVSWAELDDRYWKPRFRIAKRVRP